jgi:HAD superfamily hydrolase (TIGR01490 family)
VWAAEQASALPSPVAKAAFYARLGGVTAGAAIQGGALRALNAARLVKRSTLLRETYKFFRGLPVDPIIAQMGIVFEEKIAARIYPEMRDLVHDHLAAGRLVAIVSTGPQLLLAHSRRYLGEDVDVLGVTLRSSNGHFTGDVDGPLYGIEKRALVHAYAKERGVDLGESYAYSDDYSDLAFLEAVGHPVAVNPRPRLRREARRRGWLILEPKPPRAR